MLSELGYVAISHDDDWMSVLEAVSSPILVSPFNGNVNHMLIQSDQSFPGEIELLKRICERFKFVAEGGACL